MDARVFGIGMFIALIGVLGVTNYIPFPSLAQQSSLCIQSIVKMATVCASALSTGMDSISYAGTIIAPVVGGNPVSISANQLQGTLVGYYFLTSGTTLKTFSVSYCSGQFCTPNTVLFSASGSGITTSGNSFSNTASSSVIGLYLLSGQSPSMTVGTYYTYQFSITDSAGISSSISGTVVPIAATPTWTATVKTLNGTYNIGSSSGGGVSGVNVYNSESAFFQVQITNNAYVSGITISVSPSGQTISLSYAGGNLWQGTASFAVGAYVLTGTINNNVKVTAFSIRLTSINANTFTQPTITTSANSCPTATQTIGTLVYVCTVTTTASITITNSGCYTNTAVTSSSTTLQGTTCSNITNICSPTACTDTTTVTSSTPTTSGGSTTSASSTTASTTTTTSSTSTTPICTNAIACPSTKGLNILAVATLASGAALALVGLFLKREDDG